jgi:lipopolysaccharide/colanic/teichoic acid biosynthesis glycosyltransferase
MFFKFVFDRAFSFVGLIVLLPVFIIIAFLIIFKMAEGSILFKQIRVGQHGKLFTLYKYRTMTVSHTGSSVSVKGESRITPLGAKLRKYKLDELPELWNILKGDMSFVGPRPDVPGYADKLIGENRNILKMKPGITGPASLKYSNEEELLASVPDPQKYNDEILWPDKVNLNMKYYYNRSFFGDICLILQTIFVRDKNEHA